MLSGLSVFNPPPCEKCQVTEREIGTWIDGKVLYEKVIKGTVGSSGALFYETSSINLVSLYGNVGFSTSGWVGFYYINGWYSDACHFYVVYEPSKNGFCYYYKSNYFTNQLFTLVIRYTKGT